MTWDQIEAKWTEMARRVREGAPACADAPLTGRAVETEAAPVRSDLAASRLLDEVARL